MFFVLSAVQESNLSFHQKGGVLDHLRPTAHILGQVSVFPQTDLAFATVFFKRRPSFLYIVDKCVAGVWLVVITITSKTLSAKNNILL